jgi:outer membrane protein
MTAKEGPRAAGIEAGNAAVPPTALRSEQQRQSGGGGMKRDLFKRSALVLALALASGSSFALDLVESYQRARKVDPTILAADEARVAGREKAVQGDALLKPRLNLSAGYTYRSDRSSTGELPPQLQGLVQSESSGGVRQLGLHATQPIYDAKAKADRLQLHEQTALSEISFRNSGQQLVQRVAEAYFGVLEADESLRVTRAEKAAVGMQRDRAQARFDVGRGKITDLHEAQARYDSVLTREVSAEATLTQRQAEYAELTGAPADALTPLAGGFVPVPPQPDSLLAWQHKGADTSTRVQSKQRQLAIAQAEIAKHKLSGRPTVDLVASYTDRHQGGSLGSSLAGDATRSTQLGLQLSVPLYAGGSLDSRARESLAKLRQAEQELGEAQRDMRLQVQDAYVSVKTGVARIGSREASLKSARSALESTTLGRDVGTRTELDVLDAQQRLHDAQLDLARARYDYLVGRVRLASAAGELEEGELRALNAYLAR